MRITVKVLFLSLMILFAVFLKPNTEDSSVYALEGNLQSSNFDEDSEVTEVDECPTAGNDFIDSDSDGLDDSCDSEIGINQISEPQEDLPALPPEEPIEDKGTRSRETVAGNEEIVSTPGVLGASTAVLAASDVLQETGNPMMTNVIVGFSCLILASLLSFASRKNKNK